MSIFLFSRDGYACRFPASQLTSRSRTSRGSRALSLREGDLLADFDILHTTGHSVVGAAVAAEAPEEEQGADEETVGDTPENGKILSWSMANF